jgi:hypothetical protein
MWASIALGGCKCGLKSVSLRLQLFGCEQPSLPNSGIAGMFREFPVPLSELP